LFALEYLLNGGKSDVFNLGNGYGFSFKEVIKTAKKITCKDINAVKSTRRPGDQAVLVGCSEKIKKNFRLDTASRLDGY